MLAHGIGARSNLPLSTTVVTWATAAILVLSFLAISTLWQTPRLTLAAPGRSLLRADGDELWIRIVLGSARLLLLAFFVVALVSGLFGANETYGNILPISLYVAVWVGVVTTSGLFGGWWRAISPMTTLARGVEWLARRVGHVPRARTPVLGLWPAAGGLLLFFFHELIHPSGAEPRVVATLLGGHALIVIATSIRFGADWVEANEPFAALFSLVGSMGVLFVRAGRLRLRPPGAGLSDLDLGTGALATLLVVLGGTTFDGVAESGRGRLFFDRYQGTQGVVVLTIGLLVTIAVIALLYAVGVTWAARRTGRSPIEAAKDYAPSLLPIIFGYTVAHYAKLLIDESQRLWGLLSDPAGQGWDLFGTAGHQVNYDLLPGWSISWLQVAAILVGHVGAVIVAHERALRYDQDEAANSQLAMLVVMVFYSATGLWLLLGY